MGDVKRRPYNASGRRAQAEQTRGALIEAAHAALVTRGYAATTVAEVAEACGVSVESVYKRFGGKPGLVRAVVEAALLGDQSVPAETRSDALPVTDPVRLLRGWGQLTAEIAPKVAPILLLLRQAATHNHDLTALALELDGNRRQRMRANARRLSDAGYLRPRISTEHATDIMWTYSSAELFDLLVQRSGWPLDQYAAFISEALIAHLLTDRHTQPQMTPAPAAWRAEAVVPTSGSLR